MTQPEKLPQKENRGREEGRRSFIFAELEEQIIPH